MQINNKKNAESLAAVIIGIFILSIALMGIINVVSFSKNTAIGYENEIFKHILKSNSDNLVKKLDTSKLAKNEAFYIYKDTASKEFKILTGSINEEYKYIDILGNKTENNDENIGRLYKREFFYKSDILKHRIEPLEIPNMVFQYDANDPYGDGTIPTDGASITTWVDLANSNDATRKDSGREPTYIADGVNGHPYIKFDGSNDILEIPRNAEINNDVICDTDLLYTQKSFTMVLKTGDDVSREQTIYEQGGVATGYNIMIYNGDLFAGVHNNTQTGTNYSCYGDRTQDRDSGHKLKSVNLGEALPNTVYYVTVVQDSTNKDSDGNYIDSMNKLQIFLNGELVLEADHVDPQPEHHIGGLGGISENNVQPWSPYNTIYCDECNYFEGGIAEFISWNHALSPSEVRGLHNYLLQKWLGGKENVQYSIINTDINKYISN